MRPMLGLLLTLIASGPVVAQAPENPPIVQVGVFRIQPDGSVGGYAVETGEAQGEVFAAGVAAGGCRFGAGRSWADQGLPEWAIDGWAIRGQVLSLAADQATIRLEWRRIRSSGSAVEQAPQARELTLPLGQLVALDSASAMDSQCGPPSKAMTFGARFAARMPPGAIRNFRRGAAGGGVSTGAISGSGGASGSGGGSVRQVVGAKPSVSVPPYDAELWLVHSVPGRPDRVVPATVRVTGGQATFTFATVAFDAPGGTMRVRVDGTVRILAPTAQQRLLMFEASREAIFAPSDRPSRDPVGPDRQRLTASAPLPGPDDVLAYEMPPLEILDGPAVPDKFSIRLRLRAVGAE